MPPKRTAIAKKVPKATKTSNFNTQYISLYKEYKEKYGRRVAVLLQVGGFFEMYDLVHAQTGESQANVQELVEFLGRYVAPKPTTDPLWHHLFWGFPEHSLPIYERKLIEGDYTVVVIAQVNDTFGNVAGRELKYILSPGTFVDMDAQTSEKSEDRHIVGILIDSFAEQGKPKWYVASSAFQIATGKAASTEDAVTIVDGNPVLDAFEPFWSVFQPSEIVVWHHSLGISEMTVRSWFRGFQGLIHVYETPKDALTPAGSRGRCEFLQRLYKPEYSLSIAEYLGLEMYHQAFQCLAQLLEFVQTHTPSYLENLESHTFWTPENELLLGNSALTQLAMLPTGKPTECLLHWIQKAQTAGGRRTLRERCLKPITDVKELEERQQRIEDLRKQRSPEMDCAFRGIFDISRLHRKFQVGKGQATDLQQLLLSYQKIEQLLTRMTGTSSAAKDSDIFQTTLHDCLEHWSLERLQMCGTEHVLGIGPAHPWHRGIHAHLDELEDQWSCITEQVTKLKREWEAMVGEDDCLKLEWRNDAPFTIQTTKRRATSIQTVSNQRSRPNVQAITKGSTAVVVLSTPVLESLNIKAIEVWSSWTQAVSEQWRKDWSEWSFEEGIVEWVNCLDAEYALARVAEEYGYVRPQYIETLHTAGVSIQDMRHPIIERVHQGIPYIPHSLELGCLVGSLETPTAKASSGILLYGVNAAGKSSLSKALGLCVLLAQCGIPVPARIMKLAPYQALFTRILGNDNLWAGMSSFVVEMTEFRSILRSAGPRTLVLGDELCAGTETVSATAIVAAGIQTLAEKKTQFLFATHLHELMEMSEITELSTVLPYHLTVQADSRPGGKLKYDRQLKPGSGSQMYGLEVCRGLDMDADFLAKAIHIRKVLEKRPNIAKMSRYNASVSVHVCNICGSTDDLETHHIVPQKSADIHGFVDVGKHKNDAGNLAVLCESCHSQHHTGVLHIQGWIQTTGGRMLEVQRI